VLSAVTRKHAVPSRVAGAAADHHYVTVVGLSDSDDTAESDYIASRRAVVSRTIASLEGPTDDCCVAECRVMPCLVRLKRGKTPKSLPTLVMRVCSSFSIYVDEPHCRYRWRPYQQPSSRQDAHDSGIGELTEIGAYTA